jgi:hypothetical protein
VLFSVSPLADHIHQPLCFDDVEDLLGIYVTARFALTSVAVYLVR